MICRNAQRQLAARSRSAHAALRRAESRAHAAAQPQARAYAAMQTLRLPASHRAAGLSLVELLIALAITALLLTAVMVATDASFKAYAAAAESASAQSATRMVTNRLLTLVRTSTAHGPLSESTPTDGDWPVLRAALETAVSKVSSEPLDEPQPEYRPDKNDMVDSPYLRLIDQNGRDVMIEWVPALRELWIVMLTDDGAVAQPLLGGVASAVFTTHVRVDSEGTPVLDRATMDVSVEPDKDNTLAIESMDREPIRVIASTMPRKLE